MPPKPKILTFDEALAKADGRKRLLLTGNGFSIACMNKVFSYDALHKRADPLDVYFFDAPSAHVWG